MVLNLADVRKGINGVRVGEREMKRGEWGTIFEGSTSPTYIQERI